MRRIYTYILALALLALGVACQRANLPEDTPINQPAELPTGAIGSKATISFTTADLTGADTRAVVDPTIDVETLHLIVFDENGMLVEVCEAIPGSSSDHVDPDTGETHTGGRHYTVTLTVTDKPRIIHYVANCPVDQVVYGHETSIIGNMYVDRTRTSGDYNTEYEVAYWARIWVPYILIEEETVNGTTVISLVDEIEPLFTHVALLRNYAEITVTDETDDTFLFEGFTVYNLLDRGTVAPYNSNTQEFQHFFETTTDGTISNYSYPYISKECNYEGHALTSATLITDFIRKEDGKVKIYNSGEPFYVYERKVSVMTDEEEKWRESPPHIIIKGKYNGGDKVVDPDNTPSYYYKMDLVYTEKANGFEEIKYYNILRNFMYQFNLKKVHDVGYSSLDQAVAGAAGNNISGSSSTSKLTNVSDNDGRLWVSHTDTTLVTNDAVIFRYKYIPNYYGTEGNEYVKDAVHNELARFENIVGDVITGIEVADEDISGGTWKGWRNVTIYVNSPEKITHQQILSLKTNSSHLNRQIRYTLRQKFTMQVECTPKVHCSILQPMVVDIKLPTGMTEDMFPLKLDMETKDRTLSPDAKLNTIPVTAGNSIIDGKREELSYYYTVTIPTFDAYKALPDGVYHTYWLTNKADNASTFYVDNKYFNQGSDSWENYNYLFTDVKCSSPAWGEDKDVTIEFTMDNNAINKQVTISLKGMSYTGTLGGKNYDNATEVTYTPSKNVVKITGFKTTTDTEAVSFTLDAEEYNIAKAEGARQAYKFNGKFGATSLETEADVEVDFTFDIPADAFAALQDKYSYAKDAGVPMFVTLDRMHPADDQLTYSQVRTGGDRYIYHIKQAGTQTIKLATTEDVGGPCTVTLEADYFETQTVEIQQVGREFKSLNITNNRIAQGLGRSVNITFQLADVDKDAQKDVTVTLVNMAVNGNNTFTFNTGDSNAVTYNNGTYTIKNVVTADDPAGELKVTIVAKGYSSKETTFNKERPTPKFTTSLSKTNLGANADEEVVLSFSSEDLVDGMDVTLELDGLRPTTDLPTRAVTRYVYTVNGTGTQTITLVTTESTTTSKTCYVQLKAEKFGFEESQILSVVQSNSVTYKGTINVTNANLNFSSSLQTDKNYTYTAKYSITVSDANVDTSSATLTCTPATRKSGSKYYITGITSFKIENVSINGAAINANTKVEIQIEITTNNGSKTVTYSSTIGSLGLQKQ
ncbi:MAG: hypothetical protein IKU93_02010 [Alistipes sp.]|nr:hypothetical protein [Alistipes sp.]